jgi:hypothetical protein
MTVAAVNAFDTAVGNGAATVFNFTFRCKSAAEVAVYLAGVEQTSGFTVAVNTNGVGGTVTFTSAPASGVDVAIVSDPDFTQLVSFVNAGAFLPQSHDDANDRAAIRDIFLKGQIDRALKVPLGESGVELPAAVDRANTVLGFDAHGNPAAEVLTITSAAGASVSSRALLAGTAAPVNKQSAILTESGREGTFVFDSSNNSANVTADPQQGVYVAPASDTTGASGAWVRKIPAALNVKWFGAKGDNATDDTTAFQAAINAISSANSLTRSLYVPAGTYLVTGITITAATGLTIIGEGRTKTTIRATGTNPALAINGLWYSKFSGLSFKTTVALPTKGVVEQDGNYDGTHTQGTQGITWEQCDFDARATSDNTHGYAAFYMNRQGGSAAQGSENLFLNNHFYGGTQAPYVQIGFNALNNTFIGGNFQSYPNNGMYFGTGSAQLFSVGFQSTQGYTQVLNGGYDISMAGGGVFEGICIYGCRTESLRFFNGSASQRYDLRGNNQSTFSSKWIANHAFALNDVTYETTASGLNNLYVCTTAGTSGATKPTFPDTGTVTDGTAVWTQTPITVINVPAGEYSDRTNFMWFSNSVSARRTRWKNTRDVVGPATITLDRNDEEVLVNAAAGNVTITLPSTASQLPGQTLLIQRKDSSTNTVSIVGVLDLVDNGVSTELPPSGSATFQVAGVGTIVGATWFYVGGDLLYTTKDTATAAAGAVSTTSKRSRVTTESLSTAAGSSYTLTITNPRIRLRSILGVNVSKSSATTGKPEVGAILCSNGSATVEIRNVDASAAFNGTLLINYVIL